MDTFKEYMVTRYQDGKDKLKIFALIFLCTLLLFLSIFFIEILAPVLGFVIFGILAAFYGVYYYASIKRVEYEYIFTNGDLDIDKIMGQRKRKRLATIDVSTLLQFGKITDEKRTEILSSEHTVIDASDNLGTDEDYYLECKHKNYGMLYVIFTPSDEFAEELKPFFPRELRGKEF